MGLDAISRGGYTLHIEHMFYMEAGESRFMTEIDPSPDVRWMCAKHQPPVLLAVRMATGELHIKVGSRQWRISGFQRATAICPKCGAEHSIEPNLELQRAQHTNDEEHS